MLNDSRIQTGVRIAFGSRPGTYLFPLFNDINIKNIMDKKKFKFKEQLLLY